MVRILCGKEEVMVMGERGSGDWGEREDGREDGVEGS